ncbi:HAD family phosphatase [Streptomyces sp. NPDC053741]|uniref:HAD family hydrolase n=1 Tax=Streptomyces TaxID=1883 RepID=UPI0023F6381D|nr:MULTISPECIES: HAD family phosphatase [unclassified Streptomyces]MDF6066828.1 HAD family phosphatase [Streptomyces sp. JH010]MDX2622766.1 HAD family phosphatase [Streptomyces sp. WI03-5b]
MTARSILAWSPSAIVFDCDGTLMDTERHWQEARNATFRVFGLKPPAGFADRAKGVHFTECGALMADEAGKPDLASDMAATLLSTFTALVDEDPVTIPGAAALVRSVARHLPLAVASNCPRKEALAVEDSLTGMESAHRAGLRFIGIGPCPPGPDAEQADLWVESLADRNLVRWARSHIGE